jgi:aspartate 1-decarboxylase
MEVLTPMEVLVKKAKDFYGKSYEHGNPFVDVDETTLKQVIVDVDDSTRTVVYEFEATETDGLSAVTITRKWHRTNLNPNSPLSTYSGSIWVDTAFIDTSKLTPEQIEYAEYNDLPVVYHTSSMAYGDQSIATDPAISNKRKEKMKKVMIKKSAQLKIMHNVIDDLRELAKERLSWDNGMILFIDQYNRALEVGDLVIIQAFGRLRYGLVLGVAGKSATIGYTTPSTPKEYKLRSVPVANVYISQKLNQYKTEIKNKALSDTQHVAP